MAPNPQHPKRVTVSEISPPHPDDTEINATIAEEDSFAGALFEIAEKYGANVTNNEPRWQNGVFLREVGDFIADVLDAAQHHLIDIIDPAHKHLPNQEPAPDPKEK